MDLSDDESMVGRDTEVDDLYALNDVRVRCRNGVQQIGAARWLTEVLLEATADEDIVEV